MFYDYGMLFCSVTYFATMDLYLRCTERKTSGVLKLENKTFKVYMYSIGAVN